MRRLISTRRARRNHGQIKALVPVLFARHDQTRRRISHWIVSPTSTPTDPISLPGPGRPGGIRFAGVLEPKHRAALEEIFFFNRFQNVRTEAIRRAVEEYGMPSIEESQGRVTMSLSKLPESQSLFMLRSIGPENQLLGVMIYCRTAIETLTLIHVAVQTARERADAQRSELGLLLIDKAIHIAQQIKGISHIVLPYSRTRLRVAPLACS